MEYVRFKSAPVFNTSVYSSV